MTRGTVYLLDVNVVLALLDERHALRAAAEDWFDFPGLQWSLCALSEAGTLRFFTRSKTGGPQHETGDGHAGSPWAETGYGFQAITADWQVLAAPFAMRIHGHNQVTDAYILGVTVREGLGLATFNRALLHLAGDHKDHVFVLDVN